MVSSWLSFVSAIQYDSDGVMERERWRDTERY